MNHFTSVSRTVILMLGIGFSQAGVAEPAFLTRGGGVEITPLDIESDSLRLPAELRANMLASADNVRQLAMNLHLRRALARLAEVDGLGKNADVQAAIRLATDRILSDAYLNHRAKVDALDESALDTAAKVTYDGDTNTFMVPEERQIRHILIDKKTENGENVAKSILDRLKAGEDFAALAVEYSADPGSRQRGGDLGYVPRGRTVPAFESAAFSMNSPGDLIGPVETPFGWHILRLEAVKAGGRKPFAEVREEIKVKLRERATALRNQEIAAPVREAIRIDDDAIKAFVERYKK